MSSKVKLLLVCCLIAIVGCKMVKHEAEREMREEVREVLTAELPNRTAKILVDELDVKTKVQLLIQEELD